MRWNGLADDLSRYESVLANNEACTQECTDTTDPAGLADSRQRRWIGQQIPAWRSSDRSDPLAVDSSQLTAAP